VAIAAILDCFYDNTFKQIQTPPAMVVVFVLVFAETQSLPDMEWSDDSLLF